MRVQSISTIIIRRNTLIVSMSVVSLSLIFGMLLALLLNRQFLGRGLARVDLSYDIIEASHGRCATLRLCLVFTWNEFFITKAAPLSVFIVSFKTAEGLFWAKMSAAATITALPVIIAGWVAQC